LGKDLNPEFPSWNDININALIEGWKQEIKMLFEVFKIENHKKQVWMDFFLQESRNIQDKFQIVEKKFKHVLVNYEADKGGD
jgi:hypothetical protein